jgi:plastocyanin
MRSIVLTCGAAALAVFVVACGSGNGNNNSPTAPTTPPTNTPAPASATINIVGSAGPQAYSPNPAPALASGQTVAWHNGDAVVHRIVADDGSFDTGNIATGATSGAMMPKTNGTAYHCSIHPSMTGTIAAN